MERILARLERTFGRFVIPNITNFIVGGSALVFLMLMAKPELHPYLTLDPALALKQPWRFVTYLFLPTSQSMIWVLFALYWTWLIGSNLEQEWGSFKLNVYYLLGALGTTAAAWMTGMPQGNFWLNTSLFFAFATVFPDYEILLFFIVPIRVKWLALLTFGYVAYSLIDGDIGVKAAVAVAFANYLLFFTGHLIRLARGRGLQMRQAARRSSMRPPPREEREQTRECAICHAKQADGADIRVCSCEKCGSPRELCLAHARDH